MLPTVFGEFRVVADPELRFTQSGKGVASVRLVASKSKQVGERREEVGRRQGHLADRHDVEL
jgi:single-stranded DNA-binding protein